MSVHASAVLVPRNVSIAEALELPPVEETCRWTDCAEMCAPGWKEVPRGDSKNKFELMWDDSHCDGQGDSRLCCPPNKPVPQCRWRGYGSAGSCLGHSCEWGEVPVGSLGPNKKMCRDTGLQQACCDKNNDGIKAYHACDWTSCDKAGKCPRHLPKFIVSSRKGFGGERDSPWDGGCPHGSLICPISHLKLL